MNTLYQLVSLLDMLKRYSSQFSSLMVNLSQLQQTLSGDKDSYSPASELQITLLGFWIEDAEKLARELNLDAALALIGRMKATASMQEHAVRGYTIRALHRDLEDLSSRIDDQLFQHKFYHVPPRYEGYYKNPALFGEVVNTRFPKAIDDIQDAGSCLAFGQGTACVMHLMRVMEVGLHALAKSLSIGYAPSWESYLTKIENELKVKHASRSAWWKKNGKFYRDLSGDLMTVKNAWRNPTMHVEKRYSPIEAERILEAVDIFMRNMATKLRG